MAKGDDTPEKATDTSHAPRPPAPSPAARENQLISMAYDEAERRISEGSATSQLLTHFLKLGSTREELEQQRLMGEVELLGKKVEALESSARIEELYSDAIAAMRSYGGQIPEDRHDD